MGDFGGEFINVLQERIASIPGQDLFGRVGSIDGSGGDITEVLQALISLAQDHQRLARGGLIFYLAPGFYNIGSPTAPSPSTVLTIPSNVRLYFSQGAFLRPQRNVTLVIEGTVDAGPAPIFAYPRGANLPSAPILPGEDVYFTRPRGNVIFHSTLQEYLLPEWWGALPVSNGSQVNPNNPALADVSDALQAAIDAGCNYRVIGDVPLPPIPIRLSGIYVCYRTLVARRALNQSRATLRMEGSFGVASGGSGTMSIYRVPPRSPLPAPDAPDAALLRIEEGVDFHLQDLDLRAFATVGDVIQVKCGPADVSGRRGRLLRCGLLGGKRALLRIEEGTVDARRRRHFTVEGCNLHPMGPGDRDPATGAPVLTSRGLDVDTGPGVMVHVDSMLTGVTELPYHSTQDTGLGEDTALHLRGGSVLVEASQFHGGVGPRPSRLVAGGLPDLDRPDGQDLFLAAPAATVPWTHLTAMECESQSWWLLGGGRDGGGPRRNVVLVAVAHANVNFAALAQAPGNESRRIRWFLLGSRPEEPLQPVNVTRSQPPSLVWLSRSALLVAVGCRLHKYAVLDPAVRVVDVATVFFDPDVPAFPGQVYSVWRNEAAVVRRPDYAPRVGSLFDGAVPRLVPIITFG